MPATLTPPTWKIRIALPERARAGEVVAVKTLISHPMESGFRRDAHGRALPRNILTLFECRYNDRPVFSAELHPGVAANPFLSFFVRIDVAGELSFRWTDQHGEQISEVRRITVDG